jgi:radical SAM-linked protein
VSHLDLVRAFTRAAASSGLPIQFTHGFNPHPKIAYGPPLPVGATGKAEYIDVELTRPAEPHDVADRLGRGLPDGVRVLSVRAMHSRRSAAAEAAAAEYVIHGIPGLVDVPAGEIERRIAEVRGVREASVPRGDRTKEIRPSEQILEMELLEEAPPAIRVVLAIGEGGSMRPLDVVRLLSPEREAEAALARIHRTGLFRRPTGRTGLESVA